jgi:hypothetical protein
MQKNIVGTWRLISCETRFENGDINYMFGQNPIGYLIYSEDGYMFTNIMKANRPFFSLADIIKMNQEGKMATAESFFAYCGKYKILTADKVIHYPEIHTIPNFIGVKQERTFKLTKNRLSMNTSPEKIDDLLETTHLVWERV